MREQHDVVQVEQFGRYLRFFGEDVQSRARQFPGRQQFHQRVLVDDAAPRDVDQIALATQSPQHRAVDQLVRVAVARGGDDQDVDRLGELHRRLRIAEGRSLDAAAVVIGDGAVESEQPGRDRRTDAAQAQDADLQAGDIPGIGKRAVACPSTGAHVAIGGTETAQCHQDQAHRGVGDRVRQHVGSVAHADAAALRRAQIDQIHPGPVVDDGLQVGQCRDGGGIDAGRSRRHQHAHTGALVGQELCSRGAVGQLRNRVTRGQLLFECGLHLTDAQHATDPVHRHDYIILEAGERRRLVRRVFRCTGK